MVPKQPPPSAVLAGYYISTGYVESTKKIHLYDGYMYVDSGEVGQKSLYWMSEADYQSTGDS